MAVSLSSQVRDARLQAILNAIDPGSEFTLYTGTQPAPGWAADPANVIGVIPFLDPTGDVLDQVLTLNLSGSELASGNGSPTWGRITSAAGAWVADMTHGDDFVVDHVPVYIGGSLNVITAQISE